MLPETCAGIASEGTEIATAAAPAVPAALNTVRGLALLAPPPAITVRGLALAGRGLADAVVAVRGLVSADDDDAAEPPPVVTIRRGLVPTPEAPGCRGLAVDGRAATEDHDEAADAAAARAVVAGDTSDRLELSADDGADDDEDEDESRSDDSDGLPDAEAAAAAERAAKAAPSCSRGGAFDDDDDDDAAGALLLAPSSKFSADETATAACWAAVPAGMVGGRPLVDAATASVPAPSRSRGTPSAPTPSAGAVALFAEVAEVAEAVAAEAAPDAVPTGTGDAASPLLLGGSERRGGDGPGTPWLEDAACPALTATAAAALFMARRTRGDAKLLPPPPLPALVGRVADVGRGEAVAAAGRMATEADGEEEVEEEDEEVELEDGNDEALPPAFTVLESVAPTRAADDRSSSSAMASSASVSRFMFC